MAQPAERLRDLVAATSPRRRGAVSSAERFSSAATVLWTRVELSGRLVEVSSPGASGAASASLTLVFGLVLDAQRHGETAAWVTSRESSFFPPDVARGGVDLDALPVVRVHGAQHVPRAAEKLLRSGAFGLIVLDLGAKADVPTPLLARLLGLAERHDAAVVCITQKPRCAPSLSSLVSMRVETRRAAAPTPGTTAGATGGSLHRCELVAVKDKRRPPGWTYAELCHGPEGLR